MGPTSLFFVLAVSAQCVGSPLWGPVFVYQRPLDAMVDITNDLGIAVLQDHVSSRSNFAFSPYGVASVLVLLYEGSRGESARQIHNALRFPWQRDVTRIGFRDIHRHLRTYFSHEGYLSGITLSKTNTSLLPEYQRVLRFYGYDVSLGNPMKPKPIRPGNNNNNNTTTETPGNSTETSDVTTDGTTETTDVTTDSTESTVMTTEEMGVTSTPNENMRETTTDMVETTTENDKNTTEDTEMSTKMTEIMSSLIVESGEMKTTENPVTMTTGSSETAVNNMSSTDVTEPETTTGKPESTTKTTRPPTTTSEATTVEAAPQTTGGATGGEESTTPPVTPDAAESTILTSESSSDATSLPVTTTRSMKEATEQATSEGTTDMADPTTVTEEPTQTSETSPVTTPQTPTEFPEELTTTAGTLTTTSEEMKTDTEVTTSKTSEDIQTTSPISATDIPTTALLEEKNTSVESDIVETTTDIVATTTIPESSTNKSDDTKSTTAKTSAVVPADVAGTTAVPAGADDKTKRKNDKLRPVLKGLDNSAGDVDDAVESRADDVATVQTTETAADETTVLPTTTEEERDDASTVETTEEEKDDASTVETTEEEKDDASTVKTTEASTGVEDVMTSSSAAAVKVETTVAAASSANQTEEPLDRRKRAIRDPAGLDYPDISLQLQNGMYGSHVSRADALFTRLPRFPFLVDGATDELVPVMSYTATFPFAFIPRLHSLALEFPLDDERYTLLIILPVERRGLKQLIYDLSSCPLREVYESLKPTRVNAVIPSFMVEGFVILTSTLQQLGIWDVFDPRRSDLSGMSSDPELYVRNIEQSITVVIRNYVEIVDIQTRTMAARSQTERFEATHPFLYFVMDAETHVSLMAGKIIDPLNSRIY